MSININLETPVRPTLISDRSGCLVTTAQKTVERRSSGRRRCEASSDQERRISQREKQVSYGYATEGYRNMIKLINHDPLLKSGGILPLSPPDVNRGSKRSWDVSLRKWRRALHMFDSVFVDGEDEDSKTLERIVEEQRLQWVSPVFSDQSKKNRVCISSDKIREARNSSYVPKRIPVEENLKFILRSEDCYEPVCNVVPPSASSLIKGADISPADAGIKIYVAPSVPNKPISTPEKTGVISQQQTPQQISYDVTTPESRSNITNNVKMFPGSSTGHQLHSCDNNPPWFTPSFVPFDPRYSSPLTLPHHHLHHHSELTSTGAFIKPPTQLWDNIFALPAYTQQTQNIPSLPSTFEKARTPSTAPRRVTLLSSSGKETKLCGVEVLQRNLFANHTSSPCDSCNKGTMEFPGTSSEEVVLKSISKIEESKKELSIVDPVSQNLFPEQ
ncbi:Histone RNA hairpin-binding protein [Trypanosoma melophagium]|uniref:Histone RNA hairpin-binding protein n=1 Tax=Trypanosoma melophagium TaxID=715481 RepID=UPI003519F663|nr:Histone RNA hairpin-binding protein [Trypanosoma melophagium]